MNQYENERVLRLLEVIEITGLSRTNIYTVINENTFPQPTH